MGLARSPAARTHAEPLVFLHPRAVRVLMAASRPMEAGHAQRCACMRTRLHFEPIGTR